jgi:methylmalonyl-CoA/ethylmalonyl-CoA epimerase
MTILGIKHLTFAVRDAAKSLETYQRLLGLGMDEQVREFSKSRTKAAYVYAGDMEFQLSESMDPDGRFNLWIDERGGEGLHHICFSVDDIDKVLDHALSQGATLKECRACQITGRHAHPEGWIAFLEDDVNGIEIELMQVYKEGEKERAYAATGV